MSIFKELFNVDDSKKDTQILLADGKSVYADKPLLIGSYKKIIKLITVNDKHKNIIELPKEHKSTVVHLLMLIYKIELNIEKLNVYQLIDIMRLHHELEPTHENIFSEIFNSFIEKCVAYDKPIKVIRHIGNYQGEYSEKLIIAMARKHFTVILEELRRLVYHEQTKLNCVSNHNRQLLLFHCNKYDQQENTKYYSFISELKKNCTMVDIYVSEYNSFWDSYGISISFRTLGNRNKRAERIGLHPIFLEDEHKSEISKLLIKDLLRETI